ncbi:unnamed protein product [Linum tenue]|uniref:NAC domain-containing protein n=1 Tax=Linum tenue TaxID=586396 RepID=A0AAV0KTK9_9ROSI|nr:unnamed protein product [Linum tenue]
MCPPSLNPNAEIGFDCTPEEICSSLHKMMKGSPLPSNVVDDICPYIYTPSNLPADIWYLIEKSMDKDKETETGLWKVKGEALKLFTNAAITGWRSTLEYYEGQSPSVLKTDWLMQQYWVTETNLDGSSKQAKESSSLCRVFIEQEHISHKREELDAQRLLVAASSTNSSGSTSKAEVDRAAVADQLADDLETDADCYARGDYLEMLDLDIPLFSSSSTDNSSCMSLSSDEYFDSLALLREIESESIQESLQKNVAASCKPDEMILGPASPGSIVNIHQSQQTCEQSESKPTCELSAQVAGPSGSNDEVNKRRSRKHKLAYKDKGSSSDSSHGGHSSSGGDGGEKKASSSKGRTKKKRKNKYFCFMPFNFMF